MAPQPPQADDLTFSHQDLGRAAMIRSLERQAVVMHEQPAVFSQPPLSAAPAQPPASPESPAEDLPWIVRGAAVPGQGAAHGWTTRQTELILRTAEATVRKLRDEAVTVSWKASWLAFTSADDRLARKREL